MRLANLTAWWSARKASRPRPADEPADGDLMELLDEASAVFPSSSR
jgi:hypothetical protein